MDNKTTAIRNRFIAFPFQKEVDCGPAANHSGPLADSVDPALLSGLAFCPTPQIAGKSTGEDGVLTALEMGTLDLSGVELATLSACETGLGRSAGGEGVLGLQRAFQIAGARTVVSSLWKVDDRATQSLMTDFYENLWEKKMSKGEALRQAQITMLRKGIRNGKSGQRSLLPVEDAGDSATRPSPYYWAAFVLSGDWR